MKRFFVALALAMSAAAHGVEDNPAEGTAVAFYRWLLQSGKSRMSLPTPRERGEMGKFLSGDLMALLEEASRTEGQCVKTTPKSLKPWIIETAIFVGNWEGASEVAYGGSRRSGDAVLVDMNLFSVDPRFPKGERNRVYAWKNSVKLVQQKERWVIDDILMLGSDARPEHFLLSDNLKNYIAEGKSCFAH